ncbi:hypothetical protein ASG52_23055 [Methylobacterium sp. Leaf456]|uniref:LysR family transcriptional regulator n=1 Tax=Methylobacterium sp. Leaf456 TaxID=1736382 RepID=UPI0006F39CA1|nr:LysR family transcriptional regulator [Methylobacterium sp. Leaf456]KQT58091.1 hypothetical protein ASG52_23055 [Methylobacterium sp. Leaf456]
MHLFQTDARSVSGSSLDEPRLLSGHWAELLTFLSVAKAGSITRAAEQLGASRSTVNGQIRRLQDVVGAQLLISSASGIALTPKGEELAKSLARVDRDLFLATRQAAAPRGVVEGSVRLSCPDGLGLIVITPALRRFSDQYPGVQLHLNALQNYRSLRENSTDCMIGFSPDEQKDVTNIRLGWLHLAPVAGREYLTERGLPTLATLHEHDFLDTEKYAAPVPPWTQWQNLVRQGRTTRHFSDNAIIYAVMVKAGLGIGLLASYTFQEPTLMHVPLGLEIRLPIYASILTDRLQDRSVAVVRDFLVDLFAAQPWFDPTFTAQIGTTHPGLDLFLGS